MYFNQNVKNFSKFAVHLYGGLLNEDYVILPFGEICWRMDDGTKWFIKPESGLKEFAGQVICGLKELNELSPYNTIDDDVLCIIAKPIDIKAEFRYVICNKEVVTGSEYRWDDVLDVRKDTHPLCDEMAWKVAKADWQADTVYVCDVALATRGVGWTYTEEAKVIELNAFSSSGLYACDTRKIVDAVSRAALREYLGEVE